VGHPSESYRAQNYFRPNTFGPVLPSGKRLACLQFQADDEQAILSLAAMTDVAAQGQVMNAELHGGTDGQPLLGRDQTSSCRAVSEHANGGLAVHLTTWVLRGLAVRTRSGAGFF
jgi:hypothetical protein